MQAWKDKLDKIEDDIETEIENTFKNHVNLIND